MKSFYHLFLIILVNIFLLPSDITGQRNENSGQIDQKIDTYANRPDLGSGLSSIAKAKIFLRKNKYRLEEIFILDVGLLIESTDKVFVRRPLNYRFYFFDSKGNRVIVKSVSNFHIESRTFVLTKNDLVSHSSTLLIGCENQTQDGLSSAMADTDLDDVGLIFQRDLYRTHITNCIDVKGSGELILRVEIFNDEIVVPLSNEKHRTAVGTIMTNEISIVVEP